MFPRPFKACRSGFLERRIGAIHNLGRDCESGFDDRLGSDEPTNAPASSSEQLCLKTSIIGLGVTRDRWRLGVGWNLLPAEPTVTVLSHIPGRVAIRTCSSPSNNKQSYYVGSGIRSYGNTEINDSHHFVRHNQQIKLLRDTGNCFDLLSGEHLAQGVVWGVQ